MGRRSAADGQRKPHCTCCATCAANTKWTGQRTEANRKRGKLRRSRHCRAAPRWRHQAQLGGGVDKERASGVVQNAVATDCEAPKSAAVGTVDHASSRVPSTGLAQHLSRRYCSSSARQATPSTFLLVCLSASPRIHVRTRTLPTAKLGQAWPNQVGPSQPRPYQGTPSMICFTNAHTGPHTSARTCARSLPQAKLGHAWPSQARSGQPRSGQAKSDALLLIVVVPDLCLKSSCTKPHQVRPVRAKSGRARSSLARPSASAETSADARTRARSRSLPLAQLAHPRRMGPRARPLTRQWCYIESAALRGRRRGDRRCRRTR